MAQQRTSSKPTPAEAGRPAAPCHAGDRLTVALAGNPNSGKTTIFNALTGARQHVGNYPGVTVEKVAGVCMHRGTWLDIVDLPGTYSLTAYSEDELVARGFVIDEHPDVVVDIVDASNLERHLYLAVQFLELQVPLVIVLNMSDRAAARGYVFDLGQLSRLLGDVPLVQAIGNKGVGVEDILDATVAVARDARHERHVPITYGPEIDREILRLADRLEPHADGLAPRRPHWVALKLLENDSAIRDRVAEACGDDGEAILADVDGTLERLRRLLGDETAILIADRRYGFISGACQETVRNTVESRHTRSDAIDAVITHPVLGLPIFLGLMYLVFWATFRLGEYPAAGLEWLIDGLAAVVGGLWPAGSESILRSLLVDGVIHGVGAVVVFLPYILILFLAIAVLEDTGYMARAAFIVDRWMHKVGLHGKSFIPLILGFGCTVPAIMATRVLESRRDRLATMLILPLMSCSARFPIYVMFTVALFREQWHAPMYFGMYLLGAAVALVVVRVLRSTLLAGESEPFVMELPPYRLPTAASIVLHTWQRGWDYLKKAGTVILGIAIVMWALTTFPQPSDAILAETPDAARSQAALEYSVAGRVGRALEPVTRPLGFDWRINTAMLGAFAAKEMFVAQMGIVFALGEDVGEADESLHTALRRTYSPLQGVAVMVFCLLGFPCMATVAVMWRESGSWKWVALQWALLTGIAYVVALAVYQAGWLLGWG